MIKLGTNVLTDDNGGLDLSVIKNIVQQVAKLKSLGHRVILVSSGAVGAGKSVFTLSESGDNVVQRQVYSAIGQVKLMGIYADFFAKHNLVCAQVLATKEDFIRERDNYKNMKNCFQALLNDEIIPIVNENDVVSLTELMFTDNDELAGLTAYMIKADKLFILSNVDGVYDGELGNPKNLVQRIGFRENVSKLIKSIKSVKSSGGRGGMNSKVDVAMRMREKGIETHIAKGKETDVVLRVLKGEQLGTHFEVSE